MVVIAARQNKSVRTGEERGTAVFNADSGLLMSMFEKTSTFELRFNEA